MLDNAWSALGGRRRSLARQVYARDRTTPDYVCPGAPGRPCGQPIDWELAWPDPMSKSVDHVDERQDGGSLTSLDNLWSAHLGCNASKGASRRWEREREATRPRSVIAVDASTL
jgi:hypothetical protein